MAGAFEHCLVFLLLLFHQNKPLSAGAQLQAAVDSKWKSKPWPLAVFPGALLAGQAVLGAHAAAPSKASHWDADSAEAAAG